MIFSFPNQHVGFSYHTKSQRCRNKQDTTSCTVWQGRQAEPKLIQYGKWNKGDCSHQSKHTPGSHVSGFLGRLHRAGPWKVSKSLLAEEEKERHFKKREQMDRGVVAGGTGSWWWSLRKLVGPGWMYGFTKKQLDWSMTAWLWCFFKYQTYFIGYTYPTVVLKNYIGFLIKNANSRAPLFQEAWAGALESEFS